jgi:hypothetical protein
MGFQSFVLAILFSFGSLFAEEIDLSRYEKSIYSQHGEDGVLAKIFDAIGTSSRFCVEFGAYDGVTGSNTFLLRRQGWGCMLLDRMFDIPEYNLHKEFIRVENINELFDKYSVPSNVDLVSIDIDYNDFYIWKELDDKFQPRVVVIECNPTHLPDEDKVVRYRPFYCGDGTNYYGASILAMYRLGRSKGYSLVYHDSSGTNLFFVKDSVIEQTGVRFKDMNQVDKLYRPASYNLGPNGGHRADLKNREYRTSKEILG